MSYNISNDLDTITITSGGSMDSTYNTTYDFSSIGISNVSPLSNIYSTGATYTYSNIPDTITTSIWANTTSNGSLHVRGDAEFEGDIKLQGKSLSDSLERIEERLAILRPNEELEEKWEQLRGLRKAYMELEAEIIEKEKIWAILKK